MGSPDFAIPSLDAIYQNFQLLAVVTAPDKPAGRGHHLHQTPVKKWAVDHQVPVMQPSRLKSKEFHTQLASLNADLVVVVAFRMLPAKLFSLARHGAINLHGSLLPRYRGAAPIQRAIMAGETITGLTVFQLDEQIDTGSIMAQKAIRVDPETTGGELYDQMKTEGAILLIQTIRDLEKGLISFQPQNEAQACSAPKIFHVDCQLDCSKSALEVYNLIRALIPYPCSWFSFQKMEIKVLQAHYENCQHSKPTGVLFTRGKELVLSCSDGYIVLDQIKPQGKGAMKALDFINGFKGQLQNL